MGMQMGFSEKEIRHMYWGKWFDLFYFYQKSHDFKTDKKKFEEKEEITSLSEL